LKPSATMAKAECDRTKMTMNCLAKPTQRTGEPEAPSRAWENFNSIGRTETLKQICDIFLDGFSTGKHAHRRHLNRVCVVERSDSGCVVLVGVARAVVPKVGRCLTGYFVEMPRCAANRANRVLAFYAPRDADAIWRIVTRATRA
jgi:hypothetical protein